MEPDVEHKLLIWERAIHTQMHFAELSIKMRQIGLTLAGATIALAIVLYRTDSSFAFVIEPICLSIPVSAILCWTAAMILFAAKIIDVGVYHRMLRGAVKFNEMYERSIATSTGWDVGLTETITAYSRFSAPVFRKPPTGGREVWEDKSDLSKPAEHRITQFYRLTITVLSISGFAFLLVENLGFVSGTT